MAHSVYLDYAATTPLDERVLTVMQSYFQIKFGNPSSIHQYGQQAEAAVDTAREVVAALIHCLPEEVFFTSCGSESDNLAIRGVAMAMRQKNGAKTILTSHAEHPAVHKTAIQLEKFYGFKVCWLETDDSGLVTPETVEKAVTPDTALVSIMYANNEIGTINPIQGIAEVCRRYSIPFHTDAVQAAAYLPMDAPSLGVDLMSIGAHKFYGPKGVGALYVRKGTPILPTQTGGSQEGGLRAGTENVPLFVGLAEAFKLVDLEREARIRHVLPLRDHIIGTVLEEIPDAQLTGHPSNRLPNHCSFAFKGMDGNYLLMLLDAAGFACSSGSACKTGNPEPSEVLTCIGLPREWGLGSLRVTLGNATTPEEVDEFLQVLQGAINKARSVR